LTLWLTVFYTFSQQSFSMEEAVRYLASPELEGRLTQTRGDSLTIEYLVNQFEMMEIKPFFLKPFFNQYKQPFCAHSFFTAKKDTICSRNVVVFVEGTDKKLKEQYILVCAHFDHLGKKGDEYFPGANDNASGTAMVLYLANYFAKNPTKRSLIFACFAGEELGFLGSSSFIRAFPEPLDRIQFVINFDMVGRYDEGGLCVVGEGTSKILKETVQKISEQEKIATKKSSFLFFFGSDHFVFYQQKIPFLCFNTGGDKKNYHSPKDDVDSIDFKGMEIVAAFGKQVIEELGNSSKKSDFKKLDKK